MMCNRRWSLSVIIMIAMAATFAIGCRRVDNTLYLKYADIGSEGWQHNEPLCYEPQPADSIMRGTPADMSIRVRYKSSSPIPPLRLIAVAEDESGELMCDTLRIPLFEADGRPLSKQHLGVCEIQKTLITNLPIRKGLSVCLIPISSAEMTKGIINIGIKLSIHESDTIKSGSPR